MAHQGCRIGLLGQQLNQGFNKANECNRRIKITRTCFYLGASELFLADFQYIGSLLVSSFFQNINEDLIKFKTWLCWKILLKSDYSLIFYIRENIDTAFAYLPYSCPNLIKAFYVQESWLSCKVLSFVRFGIFFSLARLPFACQAPICYHRGTGRNKNKKLFHSEFLS